MTHQEDPTAIADAAPGNWVDRYTSPALKPYLRLMRADRPIGIWLLLWPCTWSAVLAAHASGQAYPNPWFLLLFAAGATAMRGAGCVYNDIIDKDIDAEVARTKSRPLPSGDISVKSALLLLAALGLLGLLILLQFNSFTIFLGIASLGLVALYPFMKRVMPYPQFILGLTFSWGGLMGWSATFAELALPAVLIYLGAVAWTIGYDTIYAHQDKEDDEILGLGSTARAFGKNTKIWLSVFYAFTALCITSAGYHIGAGALFYLGMMLAAAHLFWQIKTLEIDQAESCLTRFRANRDFGAIVFAAIFADMLMRG